MLILRFNKDILVGSPTVRYVRLSYSDDTMTGLLAFDKS